MSQSLEAYVANYHRFVENNVFIKQQHSTRPAFLNSMLNFTYITKNFVSISATQLALCYEMECWVHSSFYCYFYKRFVF